MTDPGRFNPDGLILSENYSDTMENIVQPYLRERGKEITVSGDGGKPIACVAVRKISDDTSEGKRLFIKPEYRGKGYARIMLKAMTDKASELGFREVVFTTKPEVMSVGYGLYKRMGFEELSEENGVVSMRIDLCK